MSERSSVRASRSTHAREARGRRVPDLTDELVLMAEDIHSSRDKPARRRFMQLIDALEHAQARYAIIGAVAMGAHGAERYTQDIDVLVAAGDLERVVAQLSTAMSEIGREPARGQAKQVRLRSKRARTARAIDIDLLVPVDAVEAWALETAVRARAFDRRVDVASTEALVVMKLHAYLSDPESPGGGQHRIDAMRMLQILHVDVPGLRRFVKSHPALAAELERVLAAPPPRGRLG